MTVGNAGSKSAKDGPEVESRCAVVDGRLALYPMSGTPGADAGATMLPSGPTAGGEAGPVEPVAIGRILRDEHGLTCCCGFSGSCTDCCATSVGCYTVGDPGDRLVHVHMHLEYRFWPETPADERCPNRPPPGALFDPDDEPAQVEYWEQDLTLLSAVAIDGVTCGFAPQLASIVEREYRGGGPMLQGDPRRCFCDYSPTTCFAQIIEFEREDEHGLATSFGHWIVPESAATLPRVRIEDRNERWRQGSDWSANDEINARINELPDHDLYGADYAIDTGTVQTRRSGILRESWGRILYSVSVRVELNGPRCDAQCQHCLAGLERRD